MLVTWYYGWHAPHHQKYNEVLTSNTSECDTIWTQGLHRDSQVKVRVNPNSGWLESLKKEGGIWTQRQIGTWGTRSEETQKKPSTSKGEPPSLSLKGPPWCHLDLDCQPPGLWNNTFWLFISLTVRHVVRSAPTNQHTWRKALHRLIRKCWALRPKWACHCHPTQVPVLRDGGQGSG